MTKTRLPIIFLACKVFEGFFSERTGVKAIYLDYGLHQTPRHLQRAVQDQIDGIGEPSMIVLGYGLCGNGLNEIRANQHILVVPRADDCIAIFFGSREKFLVQNRQNPGTYYLTKGWFEVGSDPLSEYQRYTQKFGREAADWLMHTQYKNYQRLVFVAQRLEDLAAYRPRALEVAAYCEQFGMVYEEFLGSEEFLERIAAVMETGIIDDPDWIVVPAGGVLRQEHFL